MGKLQDNETGFSVVEIVLVVVVIALIGTVGWLIYKNHHKTTVSSSTSNSAPKTTNTKTLTVTPSNSPQVFTANSYGFQFTYPQKWSVKSVAPSDPVAAYSGEKVLAEYTISPDVIPTSFPDTSVSIDYRVIDNTNNITPEQYYEDASVGGMGNGILEQGETDSSTPINSLPTYTRTTPYQQAPDYVIGAGKYLIYVQFGVTTSAQDQGASEVQYFNSDYMSVVNSTKSL